MLLAVPKSPHPRCAPAKGRAESAHLRAFLSDSRMGRVGGCGAAAPLDLRAPEARVAGPPHHPVQPPPMAWVSPDQGRPRDCTCAGPGGGRRSPGSAGHLHPQNGRSAVPDSGGQRRAAAAGRRQRRRLRRAPLHPPSPLPALVPGSGGAPALGLPPTGTRGPVRHLLVSIQSLPRSRWPPLLIFMSRCPRPPKRRPFCFPHKTCRSAKMRASLNSPLGNLTGPDAVMLKRSSEVAGWMDRRMPADTHQRLLDFNNLVSKKLRQPERTWLAG